MKIICKKIDRNPTYEIFNSSVKDIPKKDTCAY